MRLQVAPMEQIDDVTSHAEYKDCIEEGMAIKTPNLNNKSPPRSAIRH